MRHIFSILLLLTVAGCASNRFSGFKPENPQWQQPIVINFQSLGCSATDDHNLNVRYRTAAILFARENHLILVSNQTFPAWFGNTNAWKQGLEFKVETPAGTTFDYRHNTLTGCNPACLNTPEF